MINFSAILSALQAAIAVRAARDRSLTALLVAVWGRIARMRMRLERLVALWRAGTLPPPRRPDPRRRSRGAAARPDYPTAPAWLVRKLGYEVAGYGSQLRHMLTEAECQAFLAAVPQAGRVLRPLLRMLGVDPVPELVPRVKPAPPPSPVAAVVLAVEMVGMAVAPVSHFLDA